MQNEQFLPSVKELADEREDLIAMTPPYAAKIFKLDSEDANHPVVDIEINFDNLEASSCSGKGSISKKDAKTLINDDDDCLSNSNLMRSNTLPLQIPEISSS